MTVTQNQVSFPTDPYPVRPGTSAALTARTIDATVHPPLVRAGEAVTAFVPRVVAPLQSPIFFGMLAGTLVLVWVARRGRFRPAGLLLSAALMATLTSFRPAGRADSVLPVHEPAPFMVEAPALADRQPPRVVHRRAPRDEEESLAAQLLESFPEVMIVAKLQAEMLATNAEMLADDQEVRDLVRELRRRVRAGARRRAREYAEAHRGRY